MSEQKQIEQTITFRRVSSGDGDWGQRLIDTVRKRCVERGWSSRTGPWDFYEPDYRVEVDIDGATLVLIAVVYVGATEVGWIGLEELRSEAASPEKVRPLFDLVKTVLTTDLSAADVLEHDTFPVELIRGKPLQ